MCVYIYMYMTTHPYNDTHTYTYRYENTRPTPHHTNTALQLLQKMPRAFTVILPLSNSPCQKSFSWPIAVSVISSIRRRTCNTLSFSSTVMVTHWLVYSDTSVSCVASLVSVCASVA